MIFENVQELAKKRNKTIAQVERESGLAKGSVYKWKTASPTIASLQAVAKTLNVTVARLLKE